MSLNLVICYCAEVKPFTHSHYNAVLNNVNYQVFTAEVEGGAIISCDIILEHSSATPTALLNNLKDALTGTQLWRSHVLAVFQQLQTSNSHERAVASWLMTWILSLCE
eukprot:Em0001g2873a